MTALHNGWRIACRLPDDFWAKRCAAPFQHDLFQLLRRLDAQAGHGWSLGRAPLPRDEPLRLGQSPSLAFAPATLAGIRPRSGDATHEVDIWSFGLFGPNGPLPLHLTEYAHERVTHFGDHSMVDFCNLFHHRLILLFYRAWADAQPAIALDRPDHHQFNHYLSCLTGVGQPALQQQRGSLNEHARYALAGHFTRQTHDGEGLTRSLSWYFQVPVAIQNNIPQWMQIGEREQAQLRAGKHAPRLGETAFLGGAVRDIQHKFRLRFGPLRLKDYQLLLPRARHAQQVVDWVRHYLGIEYNWEVQLELHQEDVAGVALGGEQPLGYTSWLGEQPVKRHRDDLIYQPDAQH